MVPALPDRLTCTLPAASAMMDRTLARMPAATYTLMPADIDGGTATLGEDYEPVAAGRMRLATDTTTGTLPVPTLDDRRVELTETFTVTITVPADALIESAKAAAERWIEDDGTAWARKRSLGAVLAGMGRTR